MLAGEPPFQGENLLSISHAIAESDPAPLTGNSSVAQRVVSRALTKDRTQRYECVGDLVVDLRMVTDGATSATASTASEIPSIAVLPFADMSSEKDQDYFCEGLAEELIDALAKLDGLRVVARTSAFQFKGAAPDLRDVGAKLNVRMVLEGSVRKAGERLRINAQLINASDGYHVWSERYDRTMDDVFALQDDIARAVVEQLKVKLVGPSDQPLVQAPTENLEAYDLYLQGRHHGQKMTQSGINRGLDCFRDALAIQADYAQAKAGMASLYVALSNFVGSAAPREVMPQAKTTVLEALAME